MNRDRRDLMIQIRLHERCKRYSVPRQFIPVAH